MICMFDIRALNASNPENRLAISEANEVSKPMVLTIPNP